MKLTFSFGTHVLTLPAALSQHVEKATKKDMRILLELAALPLSFVDIEKAKKELLKKLSVSETELDAALAFWRGTGIIKGEDEEDAAPTPTAGAAPTVSPRVISDQGLPAYSGEELAALLERRVDLPQLIDACQQTFGKVFNTKEVEIIAGMLDYLGLDGEYILLLLAHCRSMGKKSLRYAEKMALSLHDEGIDSAAVLEERLSRIETMASAIGRLRAMFGISTRELTSKEKKAMEAWVCGMQYSEEMIRRAYEVTVDATGKPSIPYTNKVLERWHADGYRTVEDVDRALAEYSRKKAVGGSSFDADDFFEAALKRTYGEG